MQETLRINVQFYLVEEYELLANYGYQDASGEYYITIDTDRCNGCGDCVASCPADVFVIFNEDPNDPLREEPVAAIVDEKRKSLKYECNPCKSSTRMALPCVKACGVAAISHTW